MAGELVRMWTKAGHEVTVVSPLPNRPHGARYPGFPLRLWTVRTFDQARTIRVWSWLIGKRRRPLARILENITFGVNSAVALLLIRRPDVVVLESWPVLATAAVMVVCAARGIKVINYVKDIYPEAAVAASILREGAPPPRSCESTAGSVVEPTATSSSPTAPPPCWHARVTSHAGKLRVISDWLDLSAIAPTSGGPAWRRANGLAADEIVFMFAGTMGYASRVDLLVDVAEKLRAHEKIRLVCVGQGPLKPTNGRRDTSPRAEEPDIASAPAPRKRRRHAIGGRCHAPHDVGAHRVHVGSQQAHYLSCRRQAGALCRPGRHRCRDARRVTSSSVW